VANVPVYRLEIEARPGLPDALGAVTQKQLQAFLKLTPERVRSRKVYLLDLDIDAAEAERIAAALVDPIAEIGAVGLLPDGEGEPFLLSISFLPGVTDSVGKSVKTACEDCLDRPLVGHVYTGRQLSFWGLTRAEVERAAAKLLHNPLIERVRIEQPPRRLDVDFDVPRAGSAAAPRTTHVALAGLDDDALDRLSREKLLALSTAEMRAVQRHFSELGREPTDAELECLAQTWSEHCKHKIFAAPIEYTDPYGATKLLDRGLFKTFIAGATEAVASARKAQSLDAAGEDFLVSVFSDNAGVVRFTERDHLVYKVETHNSPSALDPYGGAMTGIVGVNRDSFGTGLGADLLANVWGYCFGPPTYSGDLPPKLMPPRRIRDGVHHGVIDGGNQSGIPYARGFEIFDERYLGKPLVYCGTVSVMPVTTAGRPTHEKPMKKGDRVVMIGGRVGKDGIHGATFSSVQLDESSPTQAVQIGDPITQKCMFDMLTEARDLGLYSGMTDNGAGGLSSSIGEMATATGGASIDLAKVPLKYPGLAPWEIFVSEAQERMTLAVPPEDLAAFLDLARRREVEATDLGEFTDSGRLVVTHGAESVCDLSLSFLHDGVPRVTRTARWSFPEHTFASAGRRAAADKELMDKLLLKILGRPNLASHEDRARHYDHEVKGLSVVKPFLGAHRDVPATATVMRVRHGRDEGLVLSEGVHPQFGDIDTQAMAMASVDEAVRRALAAGARFDRLAALDNFCWPDPIAGPGNLDGEHKLALLVRCCEGLHDACEAYGVPLISGKDSMKNDAFLGGVKISIPPTLLVSVIGQMTDVRRALTLAPRAAGDLVYLLGVTGNECGGSEAALALDLDLETVPRTDLAKNAARYRAFADARDQGLIRSADAVTKGGLAVALTRAALASELGLDVRLDALDAGLGLFATLFGESTGRLLITCSPDDSGAVERLLVDHALYPLGQIVAPHEGAGFLRVERAKQPLFHLDTRTLRAPFHEGLLGV
jgi:phosphoribosylformylglycinamidine synthase subunit PurSL